MSCPTPCPGCPRKYLPLPGDGPQPSRFLLIGERPGFNENKTGRVLCLADGTKVLKADLTWVPIESLVVGDRLLAFDEEARKYHNGVSQFGARHWKISIVTGVHRSERPCNTYTTDVGSLTGTKDHKVLVKGTVSRHNNWNELGRLMCGTTSWGVRKTERRSNLCHVIHPWETASSYDEGWLAGFFDGEGHVMHKKSSPGTFYVGFTQNQGSTCLEALVKLCMNGFSTFFNNKRHYKGKTCERHYIAGGFAESLRFIGSVRPVRLLPKVLSRFGADNLPELRTKPARILSRGKEMVVPVTDIQTTTGTFIANGFAVHNCGKSGQELDETYLPLANLRRSRVRCVNAVQCWADSNRTPNEKEVLSCASHHLQNEIDATRPEYIILMGGSACRLIPKIRLDMHHGRPQWVGMDDWAPGSKVRWSGWVVPQFHPALGLHEGRFMSYLLDDWAGLQDELASPGDAPERELDYRIAREIDDVYAYFFRAESVSGLRLIGIDTEDHGGVPYSVQASASSGSGIFIPAGYVGALQALNALLAESDTESVFHFAGHDIDVLRRMGVRVGKYRDTLQEAFHLGNLPQGLKALTYRLFRTTMTSWEDTVRPASINALTNWMTEALVIAHLDLYGTKVKEYKTCACGHSEKAHWTASHAAKCSCSDYTPKTETIETPGDAEKLFNRLLNHTDINSEYDPWERLAAFWANDTKAAAHLEARIGPYPILGIGNCTEAQAVRYSVGDSDWTRQCALELERRRQDSRWQIAEGDEDQ